MNSALPQLPESWLSSLGGLDVSGWPTAFLDNSAKAVSDLLWDRFYFGPLNPIERGQLLAGWLEAFGESENFASRLDEAFAEWISENWGRFEHPSTQMVSAWTCIASVIEFSARIPHARLAIAARALRARFEIKERFLGSISSAPAADPLGFYLAVIAEFQEDRSLAGFWQRLCNLPDGTPFYHARYAVLGLRRLKAVDKWENGTLRAEIVLGLLRLARSFDRLVRERGLAEQTARSHFRRIAVQAAAAYPDSPRWSEHGLVSALEMSERPQRWVLEAIPPLALAVRQEQAKANRPHARPKSSVPYDPTWGYQASVLAEELSRGRSSLPKVERLLQEERAYAEATGDSYSLVRSLRSFAIRIVRHHPELAIRWAEEARVWAPNDSWSWNTLRDVLRRQGDVTRALKFAWVAWKRFPETVASRNGLAEVLKTAERYAEAEEVYRQTIELVPPPETVASRNGLAEVLKTAERYAEAEEVYRQTIELVPPEIDRHNHIVACTGLAEVLKAARRLDEAETVYRDTIERFPDNKFARSGLADTLSRAHRWEDAETVYRETIAAGLAECPTYVGLAYLQMRKGAEGMPEALALGEEALRLDPSSRYAISLKQKLQPEYAADFDVIGMEWEDLTNQLFANEAGIFARTEADDVNEPHESPEDALLKGAEAGAPQALSPNSAIVSSPKETALKQDAVSTKPNAADGEVSKPEIPTAGFEEDGGIVFPLIVGAPSLESAFGQPVQLPAPPALRRPLDPPKVDTITVAALIAEASFYRAWASRSTGEAALRYRELAKGLLAKAEKLLPGEDAQIEAEKAALATAAGEVESARNMLRSQMDKHHGSAPLLVQKARLDRDSARRNRRSLSDEAMNELLDAPNRLRNLDPSFATVFHLEKGLAALSLLDGSVRIEAAATAFTNFRRTVARRAAGERFEREGAPSSRARDTLMFHEWLQLTANQRFFNDAPDPEMIRADDVPSIERVVAEHPSAFDDLEQAIVDRFAFALV